MFVYLISSSVFECLDFKAHVSHAGYYMMHGPLPKLDLLNNTLVLNKERIRAEGERLDERSERGNEA